MSDPTPTPWYIAILDWIESFLKNNWSGLAVLIYSHEEKKVESAKQDLATAQLKQTEIANENAVLKEFDGKSDADILNEFGKGSGDSGKPST